MNVTTIYFKNYNTLKNARNIYHETMNPFHYLKKVSSSKAIYITVLAVTIFNTIYVYKTENVCVCSQGASGGV